MATYIPFVTNREDNGKDDGNNLNTAKGLMKKSNNNSARASPCSFWYCDVFAAAALVVAVASY